MNLFQEEILNPDQDTSTFWFKSLKEEFGRIVPPKLARKAEIVFQVIEKNEEQTLHQTHKKIIVEDYDQIEIQRLVNDMLSIVEIDSKVNQVVLNNRFWSGSHSWKFMN